MPDFGPEQKRLDELNLLAEIARLKADLQGALLDVHVAAELVRRSRQHVPDNLDAPWEEVRNGRAAKAAQELLYRHRRALELIASFNLYQGADPAMVLAELRSIAQRAIQPT